MVRLVRVVREYEGNIVAARLRRGQREIQGEDLAQKSFERLALLAASFRAPKTRVSGL